MKQRSECFMPVQVFAEHPTAGEFLDETNRIVEYVLNKEEQNAEIRIVFVDDNKIFDLNKRYLQHDYVTDVISFSLGENETEIDGEIYVCIDQAARQAQQYDVTLHNEVMRLVIHGLLHLIGYNDNTDEGRAAMKEKEDNYLEKIKV